MEYRSLGRTGVQVSTLCLGAMTFGGKTDQAEATRMVDRFLDAGGNFIDTANVYQRSVSEEMTGRVLAGGKREEFSEGTWRVLDGLEELCREKGCSMTAFALAWLNAQPGVTSPIIGANSVAQLEENLAAGDVTITAEDKERVDALIPPGTHTEDYYRADFGPHPYRR